MRHPFVSFRAATMAMAKTFLCAIVTNHKWIWL